MPEKIKVKKVSFNKRVEKARACPTLCGKNSLTQGALIKSMRVCAENPVSCCFKGYPKIYSDLQKLMAQTGFFISDDTTYLQLARHLDKCYASENFSDELEYNEILDVGRTSESELAVEAMQMISKLRDSETSYVGKLKYPLPFDKLVEYAEQQSNPIRRISGFRVKEFINMLNEITLNADYVKYYLQNIKPLYEEDELAESVVDINSWLNQAASFANSPNKNAASFARDDLYFILVKPFCDLAKKYYFKEKELNNG